MSSIQDLHNKSLELEKLVIEYNNNDIKLLENTLLELLHTYEWLNFYKEDSYLDKLVDTHQKLINLYLSNNNLQDAYNSCMNIIEVYDELIELKKEEKVKLGYIDDFKGVYETMKKLSDILEINNNILLEFPRLKKYLN